MTTAMSGSGAQYDLLLPQTESAVESKITMKYISWLFQFVVLIV